MASENKMIPAV